MEPMSAQDSHELVIRNNEGKICSKKKVTKTSSKSKKRTGKKTSEGAKRCVSNRRESRACFGDI